MRSSPPIEELSRASARIGQQQQQQQPAGEVSPGTQRAPRRRCIPGLAVACTAGLADEADLARRVAAELYVGDSFAVHEERAPLAVWD